MKLNSVISGLPVQHDRLQPRLPEDPDRALEVDHVVGVGERRIVPVNHRAAHEEVQQERQRDQRELADIAIHAPSAQRGGQPIDRRIAPYHRSTVTHRSSLFTRNVAPCNGAHQSAIPGVFEPDAHNTSGKSGEHHGASPHHSDAVERGRNFGGRVVIKALIRSWLQRIIPLVPRGSGRPHTEAPSPGAFVPRPWRATNRGESKHTAESVTSGSSRQCTSKDRASPDVFVGGESCCLFRIRHRSVLRATSRDGRASSLPSSHR